jgi:hypothetical protein
MKRAAVLFVCVLLLPCVSPSTTSNDLRSRIHIDGRIAEYEANEWVLDASTRLPEREGDSRWGADNDIQAIALTWDLYHLYIAVPCVAFNSTLMLFIDSECGGVGGLDEVEHFRRNIRFSHFTPNLLLATGSTPSLMTVAAIDCNRDLTLLPQDRIDAWFLQDGLQGGALEVAIPWEELGRFERSGTAVAMPVVGAELSLLAVITGEAGTGAGDAAPDPTSLLENDPARPAVCDNAIRIPLDADEDGALDMGVSPRNAVTYLSGETGSERQNLPLGLQIAQKVIAPEKGEALQFQPLLALDSYPLPVYLTARVFSSAGQLVDVIYEESPRRFNGSASMEWDRWDGRDFHGNLVPGGVYILTISGGAARGVATEMVKETFAVIR